MLRKKNIWTPKETAHMASKLPSQKNNPRIKHNSLTSEEVDALKIIESVVASALNKFTTPPKKY